MASNVGDQISRSSALTLSSERPAATMSGYIMLLVLLVAIAAGVAGAASVKNDPALGGILMTGAVLVFAFVLVGFYMLQPNQAVAITLFGSYKGTDRNTGLRWVLPWHGRRKISLRANNMISERLG